MDWKTQYVIYRVNASGSLEEVFHTNDMKKAKYWLNYIGQPGDVCCRTPLDPKHTKQTKIAEYWCHKVASKVTSSDRNQWDALAKEKKFNNNFPEEALSEPAAS